ncbi:TetR/AcrR family transcriptional regulator [Glaciihabitans sp. dw_435]|uniref:TetR/AcrR family transcriptional regulator n=1 Tax=Glaciihabitans sp. dw_435 TaxID=2720081 RepID=UPI001BD40EFB|nr:TetR/AcrR family transcriptional regulator [Glaciihabitans sp. dw_435]
MTDPRGDRREQLLDKVVDYVLENGIADLTLRRLGTAVGSNNRMLLYYFGSREEIIVTALAAAEHRFPRMQTLLAVIDDESISLETRLGEAWDIIADPDNRPFHRLFFQIFGLAGFERERFADLLTTVSTEWVAHVRDAAIGDGVDPDRAAVLAHEIVALWRGLQATLIGLGDAALVGRAARDATATIMLGMTRAADSR